jgi:hypothetical protein
MSIPPAPHDSSPASSSGEEREPAPLSIVPPLLRSIRGLAVYYALVLPIVGTAAYFLVLGGEHLQTAVYLTVGLVAILSLSYTTWLARELMRRKPVRAWLRQLRSQFGARSTAREDREEAAPSLRTDET